MLDGDCVRVVVDGSDVDVRSNDTAAVMQGPVEEVETDREDVDS